MDRLFSPIMIGNIKSKNRIVMPAMHLNYTPEGEVTDKLVSFYEQRAKGGAGLIIVGGCSVDEYSGGDNLIGLGEDRFIPGLERLVSAVHAHGGLIVPQLYHAGRYAHSFLIGRQSIAPSAIASRFTHEEPREMGLDDIQYAISGFAQAALRTKKAGFDGVEIIGSAGYLISQFLSELTNKRTDRYGGGIANRMRFGLEVIDEVRGAVGPNFPIIIRLAGNDFMPGGGGFQESLTFARELDRMGVDAFNITGGWHETRIPQIPMEVPRGAFVYLAAHIKEVVTHPVIASNRINDPVLASSIIRDGLADMVGLARGMIADPFMPEKLQKGRQDEVMPCIGCNQGCFDNVFELKPVECMVNPQAGHEDELPVVEAHDRGKKVVVAGGGPGGLFAAKTAAQAGHRVVLFDQADKTGGQLWLAGAIEDRKEFANLADTLSRQARIAGVDIRTSQTADAGLIEGENPDCVILATGGRPIMPRIPGVESGQVVQAWDVLSGNVSVGKRVMVVGGGAVGIETAVFIARMGTIDAHTLEFLFQHKAEDIETLYRLSTRGIKEVTVIEMLPKLGKDIGFSTRWVELAMLRRYGVHARTNTSVTGITPDGIHVEREGEKTVLSCDTVVMAVGTGKDNSLEADLKNKVKKVILIGDAKKPRKAMDAIREGFYAAREI
ncbi:MAG: FAD-dependent oxidoreductase [Thermodesulfobacteriota bacterium]|nr:FAD-dependent oxidoreductase [Thermodesulfobacteriota bacterium]